MKGAEAREGSNPYLDFILLSSRFISSHLIIQSDILLDKVRYGKIKRTYVRIVGVTVDCSHSPLSIADFSVDKSTNHKSTILDVERVSDWTQLR